MLAPISVARKCLGYEKRIWTEGDPPVFTKPTRARKRTARKRKVPS
jgi:hypothetical protein